MNKSLRQLFTAVIILFTILGLSSTIITAIRANQLNADPRNSRTLYHEIGAPRGPILASDGTVLAKSEPTNDSFAYQRSYANGALYAPITGYFSITHPVDRGLEMSRNDLLAGDSNALFWQKFKSLFTGAENKGASIETSINPKLQGAAYQALAGMDGAAVAIEPKTGRILAMASTPSYDPNQLAQHDTNKVNNVYAQLTSGDNSPMINRAIAQYYPPGSTFKTVVAAAALETGKYNPDTSIPAGASYTLPGTATNLTNAESAANGSNGQISFEDALAYSSNTAFAQLGVSLGDQAVETQGQEARLRQLDHRRRLGFHRRADEGDILALPHGADSRQARLGLNRSGRCERDAAAERAHRLGSSQRRHAYAPHARRPRALKRSVSHLADRPRSHVAGLQQGHVRQARPDDADGRDQGEPESGHPRRKGRREDRNRADRPEQQQHRWLGDRLCPRRQSEDRRRRGRP
jgi:cell division protein FtsI/penicillin-binding protein 2